MPVPGGPESPCTRGEALGPNAIARSYQPRRLRGAILGVAWNLTFLAAFLHWGFASRPPRWLAWTLGDGRIWPVYILVFYALYALVSFPLDLWYGYLHERRYGLVKQGLRAWGRDWLLGVFQHGLLFVIGSCLLVYLQIHAGQAWLMYALAAVLVLFLGSTYFAFDLIPRGLFQHEAANEHLAGRLQRLVEPAVRSLPPVIVFTHPELRDFSGGIMGWGRREVLLISRPTVELGSDALLRFVLLHEMGHRRFRHLVLSALVGWVWVSAGLVLGDAIIGRRTTGMVGSPMYIPWLAMFITCWMILSHPVLAYVGRRLEYQADRFYLRSGGSAEEMRTALLELSRRNLARTDLTLRRQSLVQAMPTPARRLAAAERYVEKRGVPNPGVTRRDEEE